MATCTNCGRERGPVDTVGIGEYGGEYGDEKDWHCYATVMLRRLPRSRPRRQPVYRRRTARFHVPMPRVTTCH